MPHSCGRTLERVAEGKRLVRLDVCRRWVREICPVAISPCGLCTPSPLRIEVLQTSDVVRGEPTVLSADSVPFHAALVVPAQKPVHLEANEIFLSLLIRKQSFLQRLLPAHHPRTQCVLDELKGLLLDIVEARFLQVADHMRRHTVEPRNLIDLELPRLKELRFFWRYGNLLILDALFENGDSARIHRTTVDGVPAFAQLRRVFQYARMLQDTTWTRTLSENAAPYSSVARAMPTAFFAIAMGE